MNGELVPENANAVSALDRGLLLGDGLFETMRVAGGRVLQWQRHWERLRDGAQVIQLAMPWTADTVRAAIDWTLNANELCDATVRLTVTRGSSRTRGLLPPADSQPSLLIRTTAFVAYPDHLYRNGMRVIVSRKTRRNEHSPLSRVKSLGYLDNLIARQEAAAQGADEALMRNTQGAVACATAANVFSVHAGRLHTPPLAAGALPGTTRSLVCEELAPRARRDVRFSQFCAGALRDAEELFLTNALMGIMPVCVVDGRPVGIGTPGPVTRELRTLYEEWLSAGD